jgi:hypothetical protein
MKIRYRCPTVDGTPPCGAIVMGGGNRVGRAYRVLSAKQTHGISALGVTTWTLTVDRGHPYWDIKLDLRLRRSLLAESRRGFV